MKKIILGFIVLGFFAFAHDSLAVSVRGYYRSNGTYVQPHERSAPDGNPYNNYSYPGNYNPNTGKITGGNSSTYLNNYYNNSSGSGYLGSSYSYPTYPSTPICPTNSYSDGLGSCKCSYGYTASGGSCVSLDSLCWDQLGYGSSYDSLSGICKCGYGSAIDPETSKCRPTSLICNDQIGFMSQYNSSTKRCECMSGYEYDGVSCTYKSTTSSYYSLSVSSCPLNSHESVTDSTKCLCDVGYQTNSTKTGCELVPPVKTNDQACQDTYGINSNWDGTTTPDGTNINCGCKTGYVWNTTKTSCAISVTEVPIVSIVVKESVQTSGGLSSSNFKVSPSDVNALSQIGTLKSSAAFRKCPSTSCSLIRYYADTSKLIITGKYKKGNWYQIEGTTSIGGKKTTGWISSGLFSQVVSR